MSEHYVIEALTGRGSPEPVLHRWWSAELPLRIDAAVANGIPRRLLDAAAAPAVDAVLRHPVVGLLARRPGPGWAGVWAALLDAHDDTGMWRVVEAAGLGSVHLPGRRQVVRPGGRIRSPLPRHGAIEINCVEPVLREWADQVDGDDPGAWIDLLAAGDEVVRRVGAADHAVTRAATSVVVPLRQRDGRLVGRPRFEIESGSVTGGVGALYLSPGERDPIRLAEAMVHESHHQLLNAVLLVETLIEPGGAALPSPWKPDPRPPVAVLHGVVAFASVLRFWRNVSARLPEQARLAEDEIARRITQLDQACATLRSAAELTDLGRQLVTVLADGIDHQASPSVSRGGSGDAIESASHSGSPSSASGSTRTR